MSGKVVSGGEMVFLDDIIIFEEEIPLPFKLPDVPIFSRDELTIFYKDQVYVVGDRDVIGDVASNDLPDTVVDNIVGDDSDVTDVVDNDTKANDMIKVYTQSFNLEKIGSPKNQESAWFTEHSALIAQIHRDFIERCVDGINIGSGADGVLGHQISAELLERIEQSYVGLGKDNKKVVEAINKNTSVFNTLPESKQSLILDGKVYNLMTVGEYLSGFEKAFEDEDLFTEIMRMCRTKTPREIAQELDANQDQIRPRALFFMRDKIWNGERSFEINIDGDYLVPQYVGGAQPVIDEYSSRLREKIKHDAVKAYR